MPTPIDELASLPPAELRGRLSDLFDHIDAATEASAPTLSTLAGRAFEGEAGLAALRDEACLPFLLHGLGSQDSEVRALTLIQVERLSQSEPDVVLLRDRGLLLLVATAAAADRSLRVAQKATDVFAAIATAGGAALGAALDDAVLGALRSATGGGTELALRVLALCAGMAAAGDEQFALCAGAGLLEPILALWRGDDPLVRLNAVELFCVLARPAAGLGWLAETGVLAEFGAALDVPIGEDALGDLMRPSLVTCLATLIETGPAGAAAELVATLNLTRRLWPLLAAREPEQHSAALAAVRAIATSVGGMASVLERAAEGGGSGAAPLGALLKSHDEHSRVGALSVLAQLAASLAAATAADSPAPLERAAAARLEASLRALVGLASTHASQSAADALAVAGGSLSAELRAAVLGLLSALAGLEWGAAELCASEGLLELLCTSHAAVLSPAPDELRLKHATAAALLQWAGAADALGPATLSTLEAYVTAGPFAAQRPRASVADPMTL